MFFLKEQTIMINVFKLSFFCVYLGLKLMTKKE